MCFGAPSVEFLGHLVDSDGIHLLPEKVQAIVAFPQPKSRRQLCTFLGLVNFYHRFIPGCAKIMELLNTLLSGGHEHLSQDDAMMQAFSAVKEALASVTLLVHPKPHALMS